MSYKSKPHRTLVGERFGRLLVLEQADNSPPTPGNPWGLVRWLCACDCGGSATVLGSNLKKKARGTVSCGCYLGEVRQRSKASGQFGPAHHAWVGDDITYAAMHNRIYRRRGKARHHVCECGDPAAQWAYRGHGCHGERLATERGARHGEQPYCPHVEHYDPMCSRCHRILDEAINRRKKEALDGDAGAD